ncbi:MAG: Uma2 family endonuclease [Gemmataceae bacterium]|nr:Uma2 family endonuclease [Gemmataceae bacterium]
MSTATDPAAEVEYPSSDGKPIAENTRQFRWIATLQGNLDLLFADRDDVFVGADNLIYPVEGDPKTCTAPDVYVAFGRPKGDRPSYKVWEEGGVFPQVVFEVLSPGNTVGEMNRKRVFYDHHGAEEYYVLDPDELLIEGWVRAVDGGLEPVRITTAFVSPRLGIRFGRSADDLVVYGPDGQRFLSFVELGEARRELERRAEDARRRAVAADEQAAEAWREVDRERGRAAEAERRAIEERERAARADELAEEARRRAGAAGQTADRLAARLRELGVDPDAV